MSRPSQQSFSFNTDRRKRAVFLDRDGTINQLSDRYITRPQDLELLPGVIDAVKQLNRSGFLVVVVTNQSGVGRGWLDEDQMFVLHQKMRRQFSQDGARLSGIYYSPHYEKSSRPHFRLSETHKPDAGLFHKAANRLGIDLGRSYMVGDNLNDIAAGQKAGCRSILVLTGTGSPARENIESRGVTPDHIAADLPAAVIWIQFQAKK